MNVHVNAGVPSTAEEHTRSYFNEHADYFLEEILNQDVLYQSLQSNVIQREGQSSQVNNVLTQIQSDEAYARALQEVEDQFAGSSVDETTETAIARPPSTAIREQSSVDRRGNVVNIQDVTDPDNMTYEDRQALVETIGTESRGLSEEVISYLVSSEYKTLFPGEEKEECVICHMEYQKEDTLIILPCKHYYHAHCVTPWLKMSKACPVCKEEVFGS